MTVGHPDARLAIDALQYPLVECERLVELADASERSGLQVGVHQIVGIDLLQLFKFLDRLGRTALPVEDRCKVRPCGQKFGRQFDRAAQQRLSLIHI